MTILTFTLKDTASGEVELRTETDSTPDLNSPTPAESMARVIVNALTDLATETATASKRNNAVKHTSATLH
jgi:hypothetical protein